MVEILKVFIAYALLMLGAPIAVIAVFGFLFAWLPDSINEPLKEL